MDTLSHALSGAIVAASIPGITWAQRALIVVGASLLPDSPNIPYFKKLGKMTGKKMIELTEEDALTFGDKIKPWIPIYDYIHGLPFLMLIGITEWFISGQICLSIGWTLHILYDLPAHYYPTKLSYGPKPFYPFSKWAWPWGLISSWRMKEKENRKHQIAIWYVHGIILLFILLIKIL